MFQVHIGVMVTGKDSKAFQGVLEFRLPFPPSAGLELESLYSAEPLIVDTVAYDVLDGDFAVWCLPIQNDSLKASTVMKRFVGAWDWMEVEMPECQGCEACEDQQQATDEANDVIKRIIQKRAGSLPENPRDAEKN